MRNPFIVILYTVTAVICIALIYANYDIVTFNYVFGSAQLPLAILMAACFVAGLLLGLTANLASIFRRRREVKQLKTTVKTKEEELAKLRQNVSNTLR